MLALLYATYIIRGLWKFNDVPEMLKDDVAKILIAEGRGDLVTSD